LNTGLSLDYLLLGLGSPYRADKTKSPKASPESEPKEEVFSFVTKTNPLREVRLRVESDNLHITVVSEPHTSNIRLLETTPIDIKVNK